MSKKQVNVRLNDYDLGLINVLKKYYDTDSITHVIERCLEYTAFYTSGIPKNVIDKIEFKAD